MDRRVLLVFPVFSHVYPAAFENFLRLVMCATRYCPATKFDAWVLERQVVHGAMNRAVDLALEGGHEALIAFDDDCLPELPEFGRDDPRRYQVIPRLLGLYELGYPIIGGVGYMRGAPHTTTVGRYYPEGISVVGTTPDISVMKGFYWLDDLTGHETECDAHGLLPVDFCGMPVMLIGREVLEGVPKPLFETRDEGGGSSTHDIYFCNRAKDAGFEVVVDTHIDCGHLTAPPLINRHTRALARHLITQS